MKCFNCGYDKVNKDHEFCPICGIEFDVHCSVCHNLNPKQANYCVSCGSKLKDQTVNEEKYIQAGVVFADISGFTSLAEHYSPEQTREIINECFEEIAKPIYKYNGIIDKFIGDAVMAVFGISKESLDTPKDTVYCAIEIKNAIKRLNDTKFKDLDVVLDVSIGATYGDVILGNVGTKMDYDYTVIGDVVNIASRFQNYANPGEIRINRQLYDMTSKYVIYGGFERIKLKNKKDLIESYIALEMKNISKEDIYISREEDVLISQFLEQDSQGVLQIIGEKGEGKSFTLKNVLTQFETVYQIQHIELLEMDSSISYATIVKQLKAMLAIDITYSKQQIKDVLTSFVNDRCSNDTDKIRLIEFMSLIMKLPRSEEFDAIVSSMNYDDLKQEISYQYKHLMSNIKNSLIIIENGMYMDELSLELLNGLSQKIVTTTQNKLEGFSNQFSVYMNPFTKEQIKEYYVQYFMTLVSDELIDYVWDISSGNPMYVKELCIELDRLKKAFKNNKLVISEEAKLKIPRTLDKLNLQKVNTLSNNHKWILQVASCFTMEFSIYFICQLIDLKYSDEYEEKLLDSGFLKLYSYQRVKNRTFNTYTFSNTELKKTVYNTILEKSKVEYHSKIASIYYKDSDEYEQIAHHYNLSGNNQNASDMYINTGDKYRAQFDLDKALEYYIKSTEFEHIKLTKRRSEVLIQIVQLYIYKSDFEQALEWTKKALDIVKDKEYVHQLKLLEIETLRELGQLEDGFNASEELLSELQKSSRNYGKLLQLKATIMDMTGKPGVLEICDQSKEILLKSQDYESLIETLIQGAIRHFIEGRMIDAIQYLENALQFATQINNKALMVKAMNNLGILYNQFGEREKSHVYFKNAIDLSTMLANKKNIVSLKINLGVSYLNIGSYNAALDELTEAKRLSDEVNMVFHSMLAAMNLGDIYYDLGEFELAIEHYQYAKEVSEKVGAPIETAICVIGIEKVNMLHDVFDTIERSMNQSLEVLLEVHEYSYVSSIGFTLADYYIKINELSLALEQIDDAIKYADMAEDNKSLVRAYQKKLQIIYLQGNDDFDLFKKAIDLANNHNIYPELAALYLSRYTHRKDHEQLYLFKAKEMTMFFDRNHTSQEIEKYILNGYSE